MYNYFLRLSQQGMAFLTIQMTIFLYNKETYILLNDIILVYLIMLSLLQPILQNIWVGKEDFFKDIVVISGVGLFLSWLLGSSIFLLTFIFVLSRCVERYFYISSLNKVKFEVMQVKILALYFFEFIFVVLASYFGKGIDYRVLVGAFSFFMSVFLYKGGIVLYRKNHVEVKEYAQNLIVVLPVLIYFLFSVLLINVDRKYLNFGLDVNVTSLLAINVLNVVFSLCSIKIDQLRVGFKKGIYPSIRIKPILILYFLFSLGFYFIFTLTRGVHLLGDIDILYYVSYVFLNLILIIYMMYSTYFLQNNEFRWVIFYLTLALLIKFILLELIDFLFISNIISGVVLLMGLIFLKREYCEKKH